MAILDDVKIALRISSTAYNTEITDLIAACKADLSLSGLYVTNDTDSLVKRAIITYCKANFGYNNPDAGRLQMSYDMLKQHLASSQDYAYYAVTFSVKNESDEDIVNAEIKFNGESKITGESGTAIFYIRAGNQYEYKVIHEDYQDYVDEDGNYYKTDISENTDIDIVMEG